MSKLTDILGLFKYDPETDGANTFNITQALNNNWDKIDAWASGIKTTIMGLVPGTRKVNGKALSEDLTLTGEDIKVSGSNETSINSSLSNKVAYIGPPLDNVAIATQITASLFGFNNTCPDDPYGGSSGVGITIPGWGDGVWGTQIAFDYGSLAPAFRQYYDYGQTVNPWTFFLISTPPQVRNLTLQSGYTADGDCTFFVTQESVVFLAGGVSGTLSANQDTQIGTLPADACPSAQRRRPAVTNNGPAYIDIHTDGTVWAHPFAAASQCWFDCSFVAEGGA
ncbi:hypothetical protein [Agathobaculum sp. Marseille-P7918]|uniref:hypothetical protein n=1 Tax=Agathobaculum sp. Marseille-P7918 TaxID=2479843 RepID=UPI000F634771|nr:hypothetical protein [Agathobaculum sp. Marseille-P7918]